MDGVGFLPIEVREALGRGALIVTANQRTARTLSRGYDLACKASGLTNWKPGRVLTWDAWMSVLWHELLVEGHASSMLLNPSQEHAVWRTLLEADEQLTSLKALDSLAEMAAEAWTALCRFNGVERLHGAIGSSDTKAFQRWAALFRRLCRSEDLVTMAELEGRISGAAAEQMLKTATAGVLLVGFDTLFPARRRLIETLRMQGWIVDEMMPSAILPETRIVCKPTEHAEFRLAARWIKRFLNASPDAKIGVIVPGIEDRRHEIERVFRDVLAPELHDIREKGVAPFEFSLGVALSTTPMISTALDLLRWLSEPLAMERVSRLLLSPYLGSAGEEQARAEFDAFELRRATVLRPEIDLETMISVVARAKGRSSLTGLLSALKRVAAIARRSWTAGTAASHAEWAAMIRELLDAAGWGAGVGSVAFQLKMRWECVLDEMATLDFDGIKPEFDQALSALERIAGRTTFAPESQDAPVQVIGPLEAAGSTFDALWFLRAGELSWPMPAASSSLLPWHLRHDLGMPGTDVARDQESARQMTQRLAASGDKVIFSYALATSEGHQRISPALTEIELELCTAEDLIEDEEPRRVVALEEFEDWEAIQALPDRVLRGGARVLELQAACGFRAFAEQRLWATELETAPLGMDARQSGTVLHKALELFWNEVRTQDNLRLMTPEERKRVLSGSIGVALERKAESIASDWDAAYLSMQQERLEILLGQWLAFELGRRLPFEVQQSEREFKDVRVGTLRLNVRMDRIDTVEDGEILIDYKTGKVTPNDWLTDRPDAPQLPLYAILSDPDRLRAVAFGVVRTGKDMGFKAYANDETIFPKRTPMKTPTLEAQVDEWRTVLERLAVEFAAGEAAVQPKHYPSTCSRCKQRPLCRLDISLLELEEGESEATRD